MRGAACREYTLPRADPQSRADAAIPGGTEIGPVIEVITSYNFLATMDSERNENLSARCDCFEHPGESRVGSELCFIERQETGAKQQPRPSSIFLRVATR